MKKITVLLIAALLLFAACTPAEKEAVAEETSKQEEQTQTTQEEKATEAPTEQPTDTSTAEPLPMKVAVVVALDRYAPTEFHPVMEALIGAGYEAVVVSSEAGTAQSETETLEVNTAFTDLTAADLRGIVLIGGSSSLWENAELHTLLNDCRGRGRVTAAICLASVTLAKAGVIGEGDSACWFNCDIADPEMEAAGVADSGQPVTVDGLIITGDGPDSAEEFAGEVVKALDGI
jgi:protease I